MTKIERDPGAGFTLIEVLVATLVLLIPLLGMLNLLTSTARANHLARHLTAATALAEAKLEELRQQDSSMITNGSDPQTLSETGAPGHIFTRSWTADRTVVPRALQITITVTWNDHGERQVTLRTVLS